YRDDGLYRYYNITATGSLGTMIKGGNTYTSGWDTITAVDLDGDGQDEMFFYRDDGLYRYYNIQPNGSLGQPILAGNGYTTGWSSITAVDLDGDVDLVVPGGIRVAPGADLDGLVKSSPPGTSFVLAAGIHRGHRVLPKEGMTFYGESGAILDGGGVVDRAFSGGASNITIQGLIIQNYVPGSSQSAVGQAGNNWVVRNNEIRYIAGIGLHTGQGSGWLVKGNYIHHNGQLGLAASGRNMVIEGNRIAYNNTQGYDPIWEAGGAKFIKTSGLVVRNNHVHDNKGPGLWTDTDNIGCLYEANLVEKNTREGIFHEISYDCVIRNNTVRDNAKAGIWIAGSPNVEVVGNVVTNNLEAGIGASQDPRGSGAYGPHIISNLDVHNNTISQLKVPSNSFWGWSGIQQQINDPSIFTSRGNRFRDNIWLVASGISKPFKWADQRVTWSQWRGYGNDTRGSFTYK
ncbi:MAG TPA: right-handed parallel beta-helix repeat-containing protein, partial [Acidimicrobiia bacterium]|nr:right-handed parallel beta-helix repeat-containing protein [Acidimicrobiia bacterium]